MSWIFQNHFYYDFYTTNNCKSVDYHKTFIIGKGITLGSKQEICVSKFKRAFGYNQTIYFESVKLLLELWNRYEIQLQKNSRKIIKFSSSDAKQNLQFIFINILILKIFLSKCYTLSTDRLITRVGRNSCSSAILTFVICRNKWWI